MEDLAATSILAGRETPGSPVAAPHADIDASLVWLAVTPLWAIVSFGRAAAMIPPIRTAALQSLLLWPLAVLGCWLTLRAWARGGSALPLFATVASPVALGALARPAYDLAALLLASGDERQPGLAYPWLSSGIEYSILYVCCVAAAIGAIAYRQWSVERIGRIHAENRAALERLRALRARINPHFLFNALNSIVGLNNSAVSESQDLMAELSDLLRRTTAASERERHTVAEELAYAATYLRIQSVRHAQLRSAIAVDPSCNDALIPTLILLSLVENAVSHGLRGTPVGGGTLVEIFGKCDEISLTLVVRNAAPAAAAMDQVLHQGTGLKLLRERLEILYGSAATLRTHRPDSAHFEAAVMMPLHWPRLPSLQPETRR